MSAYAYLLLCPALTLCIEGALVFILYCRWDRVGYSALVNVMTNLPLCYILITVNSLWGRSAYIPALIALEAAVLAVEAFLYRRLFELPTLRAFLVSALLNTVSFVTGAVIFKIILI